MRLLTASDLDGFGLDSSKGGLIRLFFKGRCFFGCSNRVVHLA